MSQIPVLVFTERNNFSDRSPEVPVFSLNCNNFKPTPPTPLDFSQVRNPGLCMRRCDHLRSSNIRYPVS
ncbi:hypothetical protein [Nostoc sp. CCY 9925]|uniref:hypothetical protein n=1 Tax=Nostoc sp. CCY 9925 TaxID=3103865 RepID=UPI0039C5E4C8